MPRNNKLALLLALLTTFTSMAVADAAERQTINLAAG